MPWFRRKQRLVYDPATLRAWEALRAAAAVPVPRIGVPGSSGPLGAAPLAGAPGPTSRAPRGRLRASLRVSVAEGVFAEVVGACAGGAVLTGWALHLGCGPLVIAILGALPFLAHLVQLPAAWVTATFGARNTAVAAVTASRLVYVVLVPLPFLPISLEWQRVLLVAVAAFAATGGVVANNAWVAWMGDLVPAPLRGRHFGKRTAICSAGGAAASLSAGLLLDHAGGSTGEMLAFLALAAALAGALTTHLMAKIHEPAGPSRETVDLGAAIAPVADERGRALLVYQGVFNAAIGLSSAFYALHMLTNLGMGFTVVAAHAAAIALVRMIAAPFWGRALDRAGARPILIACSFGISVLPLAWLLPTPDRWWPLVFESILSGVFWSGHALASFTLPLSVAPRKSRAFWLAAFSTASGVSFAAAAALAGTMAEWLPPTFVVAGGTAYGFQVIFVLSSACRFAAAGLASRIVEPHARPVDELLRIVTSAALRR